MDEKCLPMKDRFYLDSKDFQYREISDGANNGLIIDNFTIDRTKFNLEVASLLIILPKGYSDVPPDMFYFTPALKLNNSNSFPAQADVFVDYFQINWQRWSRHSDANNWRIGVDGIESYLQRVTTALKTA
jgi:hypothetical protein